jgi:hypothetical protein
VAPSVLNAVSEADLILVCVMDPASATALLTVDAVEQALAGKTLVNYTTGTPQDATAMAEWAQVKGINYIDGAIMCLPWEIGQSHALLVHAGSQKGYDRYADTLKLLGGACTYVDAAAGNAALIDSARGDFTGVDADLNLHYTNGLLTPFHLAKAAGVRTDLYEALDKMMHEGITQGRGEEELPVVFDVLRKLGSKS